MPLQLPDASILALIVTMGGGLTALWKRDVKRQDATAEELKKHNSICDKDRKELREELNQVKEQQIQNIRETATLRTAINMTVQCPNGDCPNRSLLKSTTRQTVRPTQPPG